MLASHSHTAHGMMPTSPQSTEQRKTFLLGLMLVVITLALYWPATTQGFMLLDDGLYVAENPHVAGGLSLAGLKWAFTSAYASNWHPLTWISHMLDCSMFGLYPGGHHLINILFHAANTLLLFLALKKLTQSPWPSFLVAALFGWHPLHVESVAWIAERKDVLSTFFALLTLLAYACYASRSKVKEQGTKIYYALALVCFALGLLAKPMVVTLPFVMLLLDYWPLKRIAECGTRSAELKIDNARPVEAGTPNKSNIRNLQSVFIEKVPFFALALAACAATLIAQHHGGAVRTISDVPLRLRILNALTAYAHYAVKAFWPAHLSIYYLLPTEVPAAPAICAGLAMLAVTFLTVRWRARWPWFLVGWLWFVGTLIPVIGLVQVGSQAMADRYTYMPLIGLFIIVSWSLERGIGLVPAKRNVIATLIAVWLVLCLGLTKIQLGFWRDNVALFQHAVEVSPDNYFAHYELGVALADAGNNDAAINHQRTALRLNPFFEPAHYQIGVELAAAGKLDDAAFHFTEALKRDPTSQELHNNLGVIFAQQNKLDAAIEQFKQTMLINPAYPKPYLNCALAQERLGQAGAAFTNFARACELDPHSPGAMIHFAYFLATCPDAHWRNPGAALKLAETANDLTGHRIPSQLSTLAFADAVSGNYTNAIANAELALTKAREQHLADLTKKLESDLVVYRLGKTPPANWQHPP
jgi:protein O-mannosyl-transferase